MDKVIEKWTTTEIRESIALTDIQITEILKEHLAAKYGGHWKLADVQYECRDFLNGATISVKQSSTVKEGEENGEA